MANEEAVKISAQVEEVYYIKPPQGQKQEGRYGEGPWKKVSKENFAKFDGPAVFGLAEEIEAKIADLEGLSESCITKGWNSERKSYAIQCSSQENLPEFLDWTKRTGEPVTLHHGLFSFKQLVRHSQKPVTRATNYPNCPKFAIGTEWTVSGNELSYDPEGAAKVIEAAKLEPPPVQTVRSKIKVHGVLHGLFSVIGGKLNKIKPIEEYFPGRRGWYSNRMIRIIYPGTREQYIWAIPRITRFYVMLTGKYDYRTRNWRSIIVTLRMMTKDPFMKGDFRRFVINEAKAK